MREIITLQIGGCGNAIGEAFWRLITHEHGIDYNNGFFRGNSPLQLERINVFFNYTSSKQFYARALCIDTAARTSDVSPIFRPDNLIYGKESAGNNFARGCLTEGAAILEDILNSIRKEAETVDSLQGFQILQSIGGGTGSGLSAATMAALVDEYPDNLLSNYVVLPSKKLSQVVVEPYNSVLSFPSLITHSHLTFCLDNEALFQIFTRNLKIPVSSYEDINHVVALAMSGITTCLRFPGQLNAGLRKIYVNMVPFPPLHFLIPGFAPLVTCCEQKYSKGTVSELVEQIFSSKNLLCNIELQNGKLLTAACIFRGHMSPLVVDHLMTNIRNKNLHYFVDWIPNNVKIAICDIPPRGLNMSATFIGNTSEARCTMQRFLDDATTMLNRKAHLHWYTGEGMEEQELHDAMEALKELIKEYEDIAVDAEERQKSNFVCPYCSGLKDDVEVCSIQK